MIAELCIPDHFVIQFFTAIVVSAGLLIASVLGFVAWIVKRLISGLRKNNP